MASKRSIMFDALNKFYQALKNGDQSVEDIAKNVSLLEYTVYESQMGKFAEEYPEVNADEFREFLKSVGAYKEAGKSSGGGRRSSTLNTPEKAAQVGVAPENVEEFVKLTTAIKEAGGRLNEICTTGRVSFSIPKLKPKNDDTAPSGD